MYNRVASKVKSVLFIYSLFVTRINAPAQTEHHIMRVCSAAESVSDIKEEVVSQKCFQIEYSVKAFEIGAGMKEVISESKIYREYRHPDFSSYGKSCCTLS